MKNLMIINGHDEIVKTLKVSDNITEEQISAKIKATLGSLACFATYLLGNKEPYKERRIA